MQHLVAAKLSLLDAADQLSDDQHNLENGALAEELKDIADGLRVFMEDLPLVLYEQVMGKGGYCVDCRHATTEENPLAVGDGLAYHEVRICEAPNEKACPGVQHHCAILTHSPK